MSPINILIMIHGMTPDAMPSSPFGGYEAFWQQLVQRRPELPGLVARRIGVQWGQAMPALTPAMLAEALAWGYQQPVNATKLRDDERLTRAQVDIAMRVNYNEVRSDPSPNNIVIGDTAGFNPLIPVLRPQIQVLREKIILYGLGDAVYYCAEEGEKRIRRVVYEQILTQIDQVEQIDAAADVRLHVIAQSLGVTVAHDFIFGLFAPDHKPGFLRQGTRSATDLYKKWRERAQQGTVRLGSFVTTASQLPILILRKQKLVDILYENGHLDPRVLGIDPADPQRRWVSFYDRDDLLGFPTRRLYIPCDPITEIQVDVGDWPDRAHTRYWQTDAVIAVVADLLATNGS